MFLIEVICVLTIIIIALASYAIIQLRLIGLNIKDFWSFIEANQVLDKLYAFSIKYNNLSQQEQVLFMVEAEKVFSAFDKVPTAIWEDEYQKYSKVLDVYKEIKMLRWTSL